MPLGFKDWTEPLTKQERDDMRWQTKQDRLVGQLMDRWRQCHNVARLALHDECSELTEALDALYSHGATGKE